MSLFADVNWEEGSDNPFGLDPGTYEVTISDALVERSQNQNLGLWVEFSTDQGNSIRKWTTMPEQGQDAKTYSRNTSFLRLMLRQLEIPEEAWDNLSVDDFIGLDCVITVEKQKKNPDYVQVTKIARSKGTPVGDGESLDFTKLAEDAVSNTSEGFPGF